MHADFEGRTSRKAKTWKTDMEIGK